MAEKLCELKKKGGSASMSETVLWTNLSPTSAFTGQNITVSANFSEFTLIRLYFRLTASNDSSFYEDIPVSNFVSSTYMYFGAYIDYGYVRGISSSNNLTVEIGTCYVVSRSVSNNNCIIPTKISGLK